MWEFQKVPSCWWNVSSDGEAVITGVACSMLAAAVRKARSLSVVQQVDGMTSNTVLAERR